MSIRWGKRARVATAALMIVAGLVSRAEAADTCPPDHSCVPLSHATLAIPDAYARSTLPGLSVLGHFDKAAHYFAFWMPDGAPAGDVKDGPSYLCPTCETEPLTNKTRFLVSVTIYPPDDASGDPDLPLINTTAVDNYGASHRNKFLKAVPPDAYLAILNSNKAGVDDVDWIEQFPSFHTVFVRVGCDDTACHLHANIRRLVDSSLPNYVIADSPAGIKEVGLRMYVITVWINARITLAASEKLDQLIHRWTVPD